MIGVQSEASFENTVLRLARQYGVCGYHPRDSEGCRGVHTLRHDDHRCGWGWPDWTFCKPGRWVKFRELKAENGRMSRDQKYWHTLLASAGADVGVWRPSMLEQIVRELAA
jgi:hypothetical protein